MRPRSTPSRASFPSSMRNRPGDREGRRNEQRAGPQVPRIRPRGALLQGRASGRRGCAAQRTPPGLYSERGAPRPERGSGVTRFRVEPRPQVVPAAHVPLEQHVKDDEGVAAPHLAEVELRSPGAATVPGDRDDPVAVAPNDRLERNLDRQVEVVGEQGLDSLDHLPPVGLERVGGVVVVVAEERPDSPVDQAVDDQLEPAGTCSPGHASGEAGAEGAVEAVLEDSVVGDQIGRIIGSVGHHDCHGVARGSGRVRP